MPTNLVRIHAGKCPQNSVRIHEGNFPQISVRIHVQLLVVLDAKIWSAKTLSIRGSLYIWYSLQITLRLRGATPTNRHPLQSCGFSREILWHSCLEVVMNLYFNGKVCWKQYMLIKFQNISFVGLFWNLRQSLTKSSLPINVANHEWPF